MEQTTFQQRIEERAKNRLMKDLFAASEKLHDVGNFIGHDFVPLLNVTSHYGYDHKIDYVLRNEGSKEIFNKLLPNYIRMVTDEILQKVDEIDYLLQNKEQD